MVVVTDPIADFITRIKNASDVGKESVTVPYSEMIMSIALLLADKGYISKPEKRGRKTKKFLDVVLLYENGKPKISGVKRISKPSRRIYSGVSGILPVKQGFGAVVVSSPLGILTGEDARKKGVGGEILFEIW